MSEWVEGIDMSVYGGLVGPGVWKSMYDAGQRVAVVGSAHPMINPHAAANLNGAREAGLITATYAALHPVLTGETVVNRAKQGCGEEWERLSFVAIDCETDGISADQIARAVIQVRQLGQRPVIYTAYWWWHDHFLNNQKFNDLPLWNAYYDNAPDVDFAKAPYGGWTVDDVIGEQYGNTQLFQGVSVDRNTFRKDFVQQGENMPTPEQWLKAAEIYADCAKSAAQQKPLTEVQKAQLRFLIA